MEGADEFDSPPDDGSDLPAEEGDAPVSTAGDDAVLEALAGAPPALLEAKAALETQVESRAGERHGAFGAEAFAGAANLQGVGVGLTDVRSGGAPGDPALVLFTAEATSIDTARSLVADAAGVSLSAAGAMPVCVQVTGIVDAQPHRFKKRPAPGGISVSHRAVTVGTLACLARGRTAPRSSRVLILSNNHVLANANNAKANDCISQPGRRDGGTCQRDRIAVLERFVRLRLGGAANYVDCAVGWAFPERVRRELVYLAGGAPVYFRVSPTPVAPSVGMVVGKTGRTTQLTQGQITAVGVAVNVDYGARGVAHFKDQIAIRKPGGGMFSQSGDSGALVWRWDGARRPVGLLFAAGGETTFANRITRVLDALAIKLYT